MASTEKNVLCKTRLILTATYIIIFLATLFFFQFAFKGSIPESIANSFLVYACSDLGALTCMNLISAVGYFDVMFIHNLINNG